VFYLTPIKRLILIGASYWKSQVLSVEMPSTEAPTSRTRTADVGVESRSVEKPASSGRPGRPCTKSRRAKRRRDERRLKRSVGVGRVTSRFIRIVRYKTRCFRRLHRAAIVAASDLFNLRQQVAPLGNIRLSSISTASFCIVRRRLFISADARTQLNRKTGA